MGFLTSPRPASQVVDAYYLGKLKAFETEVAGLLQLTTNHAPLPALRRQFIQTRKAYKHLAVLTEYFNDYETRFLNGPALRRVEEDNPDAIIPPHGLQLIEELLFATDSAPDLPALEKELQFLQSVISRLENEPDRVFKFKDEYVFDALNAAVVRLITLGITGFDSPVAQQSIPEARETLVGLRSLVSLYEPRLSKANSQELASLHALIEAAGKELDDAVSFNKFDRLRFINKFADPIYGSLRKLARDLRLPPIEGRKPINENATSLFAEDIFNISFFSPGEQYQPTAERVALGKKLFYDPILSQTGNRSCGSCHRPGLAFTDGLRVPQAIDGSSELARNTPTLWNSVFQNRLFYDSRADFLENQLNEVIHNEAEMKGSLKQSAAHLKNHPVYAPLFREAYSGERDPVSPFTVANAISSYLRTLVALNSKFDMAMRGEARFSKEEKRGFNLFMGKGRCATCHFIPLFNGMVPAQFNETESEILGVPAWKAKALDPDPGKYNFTRSVIHKYSFKTPTLRNIALTAPYMHNGVFKDLDEVMDFYNQGGGQGQGYEVPNQTLSPEKLGLSRREKRQIIAFLKTLTDTSAAH